MSVWLPMVDTSNICSNSVHLQVLHIPISAPKRPALFRATHILLEKTMFVTRKTRN